jgi:large-conductance mechanosensitive channel
MASLILSQVIDSQQVIGNFRDFLVNNGVITMASGIIIGISTMLFLKSFVSDIGVPLLFYLIAGWVNFVSPRASLFIRRLFGKTTFMWIHFIQEFITWIVITFCTFFVLEYVVRRSFLKQQLHNNKNVSQEETPHGFKIPKYIKDIGVAFNASPNSFH